MTHALVEDIVRAADEPDAVEAHPVPVRWNFTKDAGRAAGKGRRSGSPARTARNDRSGRTHMREGFDNEGGHGIRNGQQTIKPCDYRWEMEALLDYTMTIS